MDVKSVFFNGKLEEDIYIYIYVSIEGYINSNKKDLVYIRQFMDLNKALMNGTKKLMIT